jgi:hypothetical protein
LGVLKSLGEVLQLLLDEETGGLLGEVDADHGAVATVGSAEGVVWREMEVSIRTLEFS